MLFAEFLGAGVGIVIGTLPIDGAVLGNDFVLPLSRHRHRAYLAETPEAVIVVRLLRQQEHFESAPQVSIRQTFSDLRFSEAAQWITESVVWIRRS